MVAQLTLGNVLVDVVFKDIKNVHLSVHPPTGQVRIAAPLLMRLDTVRVFAISKLAWIKQQQRKLQEQERETPREYSERESHYVWGKRYLLKLIEEDKPASVELTPRQIILHLRPGANIERRHAILEEWYREQLRNAVFPLLKKWEGLLAVRVRRFFVQRMKTKWGSCNPKTRSIRLNTELAKKPRECLEYIVVHEMAHLLVRQHNDKFVSLLDRHLPHWRVLREELNRAPLSHSDWKY